MALMTTKEVTEVLQLSQPMIWHMVHRTKQLPATQLASGAWVFDSTVVYKLAQERAEAPKQKNGSLWPKKTPPRARRIGPAAFYAWFDAHRRDLVGPVQLAEPEKPLDRDETEVVIMTPLQKGVYEFELFTDEGTQARIVMVSKFSK